MKTDAQRLRDQVHKEKVGRNLMTAREALGKTRADWISEYGLYPSKISQWEGGVSYPDTFFLMALCEDYGLTMDWFLRGVRAGVASSVAEVLRVAGEERSEPFRVGARRAAGNG